MGICDGRVVVITGAGRGLGRSQRRSRFAREGAKVVVNDLGGAPDGTGASAGPAHDVVDEIRGMGGEAVANSDDVADFDAAAGIIGTTPRYIRPPRSRRQRRRHSTAANVRQRHARRMGRHDPRAFPWTLLCWPPRRRALARPGEGGRVGRRRAHQRQLGGPDGQRRPTAYTAAKAGVAMTIVQAVELGRYGVTVNGLAPSAARSPRRRCSFRRHDGRSRYGLRCDDHDNISPLSCGWAAPGPA